jgi:hypothetical protein
VRFANFKMKNCFSHLAQFQRLVAHQPLLIAEAYKRNTGTSLFPCTGIALRKKTINQTYILYDLEMKGPFFIVVCSPAFHSKSALVPRLRAFHFNQVYEQRWRPATPKVKCYISHLVPGEALLCRLRYEAKA